MALLIWMQVLWGGEWGGDALPWTLYGAELRKTSALAAPRAYTLLLNGATAAGLPYQTDNPRLQGLADSAVSDCISLSAPAYVAFAYQRGGLMDPPEADDTLSLWGLTVEGTWERLWHTEGSSRTDSAFTVVYVPLAEPKWFHPCLRLKWTTWGSTYGAYDNWFIAYTYVQRDAVEEQKTFFWTLPRVYGGAYGSWPAGAALVESLVVARIGGQPGTSLTVSLRQAGILLDSQSLTLGAADTVQVRAPRPATPGIYPLSWAVESPFSPPLVLLDTLRLYPPAWGYDDGEMEGGYGLRQVGIAACQAFQLDTPQQIVRVGMRFFPVPTQYGKPFQLGIWDLKAGTTPLYLKFERINVDSPWVWYAIDTPIVLQGRVGIGFIQADDRPLGVGWDASYTGPNLVWVQSGGGWVASRLQGCMLLRIETAPATTALRGASEPLVQLPKKLHAGQLFWVEGALRGPLRVWDSSGRLVALWQAGMQQAPFTPGLYFIQTAEGLSARLVVLP